MKVRVLMLAALVAGCGESIRLIDPPVELTAKDSGTVDGPPSIVLGFFSEQFFNRLAEGDELPIVAGFQGGDWVMPAIRANVLIGTVTAEATVTLTGDGEVVGRLSNATDRLQPTAEGQSEIVGLPIPIRHEGSGASRPIDDLYGQRARITMMLVDGQQRQAETTIEVVLVED